MATRIFRCRNCEHMVRFGSVRCGQCGAVTTLFNWRMSHVLGLCLASVLAGIVLMLA